MIEAIILAGGLGTRLRSVVPDLPKPMAPVLGRPFLELLMRSLAKNGITRIILATGYMSEKISDYFGNKFDGVEIIYSVESEPLGTGGAVLKASRLILGDHFYVFNGDTFLDIDLVSLETKWLNEARQIIVAREVEDTARYGRLSVLDGQVTSFSEKGQVGRGLINAGCYVFCTSRFKNIHFETYFSLDADFIEPLVKSEVVLVHVINGLFIDIGVPSDFERAQSALLGFVI